MEETDWFKSGLRLSERQMVRVKVGTVMRWCV